MRVADAEIVSLADDVSGGDGVSAAASADTDPTRVQGAREQALRTEPRPESRAGSRHALALGWSGISFFNERQSHYTFHSASIGYLGSFGARGPFVHASALLPLQARQDNQVYAAGDYYRPRSGGDLLAGWQWRWRVRSAEIEAGPGLHATILWLPGRSGYRDFNAFPVGVGLGSTVRWRSGAQVFSRGLVVGAYGSAAYDMYDPLHAHDLAHGVTSRLGLLFALEREP